MRSARRTVPAPESPLVRLPQDRETPLTSGHHGPFSWRCAYARSSDTITAHYRGTLTDGTEFESSYKSGKPITIPVGDVIPGWTEALQLMKEGDKWQLFIPAKLAYGEQSPGGKIGPNSTLIFDVELLAVEKGGK